jgi:hypothetical protein
MKVERTSHFSAAECATQFRRIVPINAPNAFIEVNLNVELV